MKKVSTALILCSSIFLFSCEKDDCGCDIVNVNSSSYSFKNVDHSEQDMQIEMLHELIEYMEGAAQGDSIEASTLQNIFENDNYTWQNSALNNTSINLASKAEAGAKPIFQTIFQDLQSAASNGKPASNGVAGYATSASGKTRIFNAKGYEPAEVTEKLAMGAIFYYQATSIYLSDSEMNVDNETVTPGEGTLMQHHWDEAFGYWGVPNDFGTTGFTYDKTASYHRFWAKYTHEVDQTLNVSSRLMQAFVKGREAINHKDYATRDAAIADVRDIWETVTAAMAIHYLNGAISNIGDDITRNHMLSEGAGFISCLRFNKTQKMSDADIDTIMQNQLANLYEVSVQDLNLIKNQIANIYQLNDVKDQL